VHFTKNIFFYYYFLRAEGPGFSFGPGLKGVFFGLLGVEGFVPGFVFGFVGATDG
jgi:hypothetical protein